MQISTREVARFQFHKPVFSDGISATASISDGLASESSVSSTSVSFSYSETSTSSTENFFAFPTQAKTFLKLIIEGWGWNNNVRGGKFQTN